MNINDLLAELGNQMGLDNLKLDENGVCRLVFDSKYAVDIEASDDRKTVHMYSAVGSVPPDNRELFFEILLEANLFGKGTGGSAFGLDSNHSEVYLCRAFNMDSTDYQDFVNALESFVNHIESWTDGIESGSIMRDAQKGGGASSKGSTASNEKPMDGGFIRA